MAHKLIVPLTLPIELRCLRWPTEWRPTSRTGKSLRISGHLLAGEFRSYDPWELRQQFFRIKEGNETALINFLNQIGIFGPSAGSSHPYGRGLVFDGAAYEAAEPGNWDEEFFWETRRDLVELLSNTRSKKFAESLKQLYDAKASIQFRLEPARLGLVITTTTFFEACLISIQIDHIRGARIQKCARPDCATVFTVFTSHRRKFCSWYCGHLESVRKGRRKARKLERKEKL